MAKSIHVERTHTRNMYNSAVLKGFQREGRGTVLALQIAIACSNAPHRRCREYSLPAGRPVCQSATEQIIALSKPSRAFGGLGSVRLTPQGISTSSSSIRALSLTLLQSPPLMADRKCSLPSRFGAKNANIQILLQEYIEIRFEA